MWLLSELFFEFKVNGGLAVETLGTESWKSVLLPLGLELLSKQNRSKLVGNSKVTHQCIAKEDQLKYVVFIKSMSSFFYIPLKFF